MNTLDKFCQAIQSFEGWFSPGQNPDLPNGSASYRNNNPGNLRYSGYTASLGAYSKSPNGFCIFRSYQDGYNALKQFVTDCANGQITWTHGGITVLQFFEGIDQGNGKFLGGYAPSSDDNQPRHYAATVAAAAGLTVDSPLKSVLS